jgi:hypothetical protein
MLRNRSRCGQLNRAADAVLTAGTMHAARVSGWIEFLERQGSSAWRKIALQTSGDFIRDEYLRKTGLLLFH